MDNKRSWIILLVVLVVVAIGLYLIFVVGGHNVSTAPQAATGAGVGTEAIAYQAVFLENNQVYFGKLSDQNAQFVTLKDIYYLQVNQQIQPAQTRKGEPAAQPNQEINLVKLGGELHGPTDEMRINRDHILLIEDLRPDGNLVRAIENYKARQKK